MPTNVVDACVLLSKYLESPPYTIECSKFVADCCNRRDTGISDVTLGEIARNVLQQTEPKSVLRDEIFRELFYFDLPKFELLSVPNSAFETVRILEEEIGFRGSISFSDLLQVATAIENASCTGFVTTERDLISQNNIIRRISKERRETLGFEKKTFNLHHVTDFRNKKYSQTL